VALAFKIVGSEVPEVKAMVLVPVKLS
jgi:hypothetical protein